MDSIFDWLRSCGGKDTLIFDTRAQALLAKELLESRLSEDLISLTDMPVITVKHNCLILSIQESLAHAAHKTAQAAEPF